MRNALGSWKTLLDGNDNVVQWQHIVDLYNYQKTKGFTLANKLTKQHVMYEKNRMKVKYAAQVLSKSVSNALLTLSALKNENFKDVDATVEYLQRFDTIYDIMNSKTCTEHFEKSPLHGKNEEKWKLECQKTVTYICNLKTSSGKNVLQSEKFATFLGYDILYCIDRT